MTGGADLLRYQFDRCCQRLLRSLDGLDHAEFFWEPAPGCWTVHRREDDRGVTADGSGDWVIDYALPEPRPAPLTTIAWRIVHLGAVNILYWDYAFGPATASFDLELPGDATTARQWLVDSQRQLIDTIAELSDADLDEPRRTNWGERWPTWRLLATLVDEQTHHGAEISLLRDLYRVRDG